jgi:RNA polymerase sigma-70 factor (ECF subfamily)
VSKDLSHTEKEIVAGLQAGDEAAFAALVDGLHGRLLALARTFTSSPSLAEDIVQETWLAVVRGVHGFQERSSLRTWIFSILVRRAKTMAARETRQREVANPPGYAGTDSEQEWEPGLGRQGLWNGPLASWGLENPEEVLQREEGLRALENAVADLPDPQRRVVLLRDVEDVSPADICNILGISETNQRVLLHRGRARIRRALDQFFRGGGGRSYRAMDGATSTTIRCEHSRGSIESETRAQHELP